MKRVIINADDLFLNDKINEGIGELVDRGIVTSVSVIVNFNYSPEKFREFYNKHPNASYGLHVNLTDGFPLSDIKDVRSIVNSKGMFYKTDIFLFKVHFMNPYEIRKEINRQIDYYMKSGIPLTHLDSHAHVFWVSGVMRKLQMEIASKYGIPSRFPKVTDVNNNALLFKILKLYLNLHKNNMLKHVRMPDALIDLFGKKIDKGSVEKNIRAVNDGITELLTHPGYACCEEFYEREKQLKILKSDWFLSLIENYELKLCSFSAL